MVQESGEVWVVLDALDECTVRDELLSWLKDVRTGEQNVHLLVTSRPERDIRSALEEFSHEDERILIQDDLIEADIRSYVYAQIREDKNFEIWNTRPDIQDEMETSLVSKANGMFRWVWCQLTALRQCRDPVALRKALASLPRTLDETYARILTNIPPEYVDHTIRILQFLTYSERLLRLAEAVDAIAVDVGAEIASGLRFNPLNRMPIPSDIVGYCSSLVVLVRRTDNRNKELIIEEIQLAHFSVKNYLASNRLPKRFARYLENTFARNTIAEVCLQYLSEIEQSRPAKEIKSIFHFAHYSAQYWASYAAAVESSEHVFGLAKELLLSRERLESWCRLFNPDSPWQDDPAANNIASALYYASFLGLPRCVGSLLDNGADINARGGRFDTPLQAAVYQGHTEIVKMLLNREADVNAEGKRCNRALQAAAFQGHGQIVRILLDRGADVNAEGDRTLQAATHQGHKEIVKMLLEYGTDINVQSKNFDRALQAAVFQGHAAIVRILQDHAGRN